MKKNNYQIGDFSRALRLPPSIHLNNMIEQHASGENKVAWKYLLTKTDGVGLAYMLPLKKILHENNFCSIYITE
jgi:hypothetical protein